VLKREAPRDEYGAREYHTGLAVDQTGRPTNAADDNRGRQHRREKKLPLDVRFAASANAAINGAAFKRFDLVSHIPPLTGQFAESVCG
jgi:hypothetical protein